MGEAFQQHGRLPVLSPQLLQERLGFLQISGVKALREPAVDRRQQRSRFVPLALLLPQAAQAQRGAQLQCLGLLAAGHVEGLVQTGCHLGDLWEREAEE